MKICLTLKIIVCGLLCVLPVDIKGPTCPCLFNDGECTSCYIHHTSYVGCYLKSGWCYYCQPNCTSCSSQNDCDVCKPGYYRQRFDHYAGDGNCRQCPKQCVTCNSNVSCTSCIAGRTGSYCQNCIGAYYLNNGQCYQCNTNCLHDTCFDNSGECTDGCENGWAGWTCNDACGPNCASCDRQNGTACIYCKPGYYGPICNMECSAKCGNMSDNRQCQQNDGTCLIDCVMGYKGDKCDVHCDAGCRSDCDRETGVCEACEPTNFGPSCQHLCNATCYDPGNGSNVCHQLSGECLFDCSQLLCSPDGQTSGNQGKYVVIGGAVGSIVVIVLIIVAVLVFIFVKRSRRNMSDLERSVTYENSPTDNGPYIVSVTDSDRITESTADYTSLTLSHGPVTNREDHYTALTPSLGPVYEEIDKNDDVDYGDIKGTLMQMIIMNR